IQEPPLIYRSNNRELSELFDIAERAAPSEASILILGSSGTGKSVIARYIHQSSSRKDNAFVTISCPSLSKELLESELFGHVKGAFTGAVKDTWGKVDAARGGTLFLDEIGELPAELQPKLLRLLQEKQYERLGETKVRTADIRVIAATNKDPKHLVKEGSFREDLFYRLNVISLKMPSLKDRPDDLEQLSDNFLNHFAAQSGLHLKGFSKAARECLRAHTWPGNIRELRNVIERAVILARGEEIEPTDLPEILRGAHDGKEANIGDLISIELVERIHAQKVIERTESLEQASKVLGIDSATLYRKRKKWAAGDANAEETT
ncbi:MAG: sigma-54 dependent transcriptional regulator, partial [Verrucomicrobiae bacterium]|nr:sigma-54 dependent transcriptional regulator [Verrucomicrobiae bacterium]